MSTIQGKIKSATKTTIEFEDNTLISNLIILESRRKWIRIKNSDTEVAIRYIKYIDKTAKKIELDTELPFVPKEKLFFNIDTREKNYSIKAIDVSVKKDSTKSNINLIDNAKKLDNVYKGYWILFKDQVRQVKNYKDNIITLDYDLINVPAENEKIKLFAHFFNDYMVMGVDFTNLMGVDFSSLIDSVGGIFNFQIGSVVLCCCCCILVLSMLFFVVGKGRTKSGSGGGGGSGLYIPGLGKMGTQQPLIIQMPMQTKPYPYNDSPFPRDT